MTIRTDRIEKMQAIRKDHREHDPDSDEQKSFEAILLQGLTLIRQESSETPSQKEFSTSVHSTGKKEVSLPPQPTQESQASDLSTMEGMKVLSSWPDELHLRLLTGPMSGMEIHASLAAGVLAFRLEVQDKHRFDKLRASREKIEASLGELFDCSIKLEVNHDPV